MAIERYGSKTDVVVKLVLVFFVCLLFFSVGTFVGKKFSDNQHKLAEFEPTAKEREVASVGGVHAASHGETEKKSDTLSDEEIAKLAEEFVSEEEGRAPAKANIHGDSDKKILTDKNTAHEVAAPAVTVTKPANSHDVTEAQAKNVERKIAQASPATIPAPTGSDMGGGHDEKRPLLTAEKAATGHLQKIAEELKKTAPPAGTATMTATEAKKPIPTSLPKELAASTLGKYTVQVASFPSEPEAKKMAEGLAAQGFSAFYLKADVKGKSYFRVSVGLFPTAKEADAYRADLIARAKVSSAIVQVIKN